MTRKLTGQKLVIASHNAGKNREISELLAPLGIEALPVSEFGLAEPVESEDSFAGNARLKAHFAAKETGLPALSDDSGIMIDALGGAPGVYTADWAETPKGRDFKMAMTRAWREVSASAARPPFKAAFCCTLCLAWPDGHDEIFEGKVAGHLTWPMRGALGFGYDPIFVPIGETQTFGEMDPQKKHAMSHRAVAFQDFLARCVR